MKVMFALIAAWLSVATPGIAQSAPAGQVVEVQVPAPALAGNLLNTPTVQPASIYLPANYGRRSRRYPVIYLLHGIADTRQAWLGYIGVKAILDRSMASHRIPEAIVVMPDATNLYGGGFYLNSPVSGRWEDYIAGDLVRYVDAHYRTLARAGGRALVGWSMGGFGAINVAMNRPGEYAAIYGISPCCLAPVEDIGQGNDAWRRALTLRSADQVQAAAQQHDFYIVAIIGLLSAFDPAPAAPPFFVHFPYKLDNGQVVPDPANYDRFVAQFPVNRVVQSRDALSGLRAFGFDYGIGDQYAHIPVATRLFSNLLAQARIPHRFEVYDGDHRTRVAARLENVVLPYVANALDAPE